MPKRSNNEVQALMQKAFKLLDDGVFIDNVAAQLHVTTRTIYRWIKAREEQPPEIKAQRELAQIIYQPVPKLPEPEHFEISQSTETLEPGIVDLQDYHKGQKLFAIKLGLLAAELIPKVEEGIKMIQTEDITVRSVSSLMKTITDAINLSSDCWSRAVGLDQVLERINKLHETNENEE